jgi:hypothetical protein
MPSKPTPKSRSARVNANSASPSRAPRPAKKLAAAKVARKRHAAAPEPVPIQSPLSAPSGSKVHQVVSLMRRDAGASLDQLMEATGWQAQSVRGTISGVLRKRLQLNVVCEASVYRIVEAPGA